MNPKSLMEGVAALIKDGQSKVLDGVKQTLANVELAKRERAIIAGLERLPDLEKAVEEIKPDVVAFAAGGEPIGEPAYSQGQLDKLNSAKAVLNAMNGALEKAFNKGEYEELFELTDSSAHCATPARKK